MRRIVYGAGFLMVLASLSTAAMASTPSGVPEVSGGSLSMGLGLLAGGILMLRARFGRK